MKSISITGKRNTDKIKSLENPDMICERNSIKKFSKEKKKIFLIINLRQMEFLLY
jgi:hypothetical protein